MGQAAGPLAAVSSLASVGFGYKADIAKSEGEAAGAEFEAKRHERAAEIGRLRAVQTEGQMLEELHTTLANIDVTRAAANTSIDSPTAIALGEEESRVARRDITNRTLSLRMQASEEEAAALYKHKTASDALRYGKIGATAKAIGGLSKGISSVGSYGG